MLTEFVSAGLAGLADTSWMEWAAIGFAIAYLLLAMRENIWCWACAAVSTVLYTIIYFEYLLPQEALLNIYYLGMAGYGWWQWRSGRLNGEKLRIHRWPVAWHLVAILVLGIVVAVAGYLFDTYTESPNPYLDAFTTWPAVFTTLLVARKVLENWLYWIVIDAVAVYLNAIRGLEATSLLFALYTILAIIGYVSWYKTYKQQ